MSSSTPARWSLLRLDAAPEHVDAESDEALMVRLMEGSGEAFDSLYARHSGRIHAFIDRFTGDAEAADDLTQEVFLKVYRNPRLFDPRGRFLTWIYAVARNACIDFLRLKKLPTVPISGGGGDDDPGCDPPSVAHEGPEARALDAEMQEQVDALSAKLSRKLREVFVLCAVQGLSYEDAAEIIGCPVKTVSSRLSRARERFLKEFRRYLDGDRPEAAAE
jgi:RNA polymerase sigma-70 factor (ECF subfamily)